MSDLDELLPRRLDGLSDDLARMRLKPPVDVRRRGARRTRNRTTVATLATLAVAGVAGFGVLQGLPDAGRTQAPIPATHTSDDAVVVVSPTATLPPTPTTTAPATATTSATATTTPITTGTTTSGSPLFAPATALLPAKDLPVPLGAQGQPWLKPARSTDGSFWARESTRAMLRDTCWGRPVVEPRQEIVGEYTDDGMAGAIEVAAVADNEEAAVAAYAKLRSACRSAASPAGATLPPDGGSLTHVTDLHGDDPAFRVIEELQSESGEPAARITVVVQRGDRVVLLDVLQDYSPVSSLDPAVFEAAAARAMDRVTP